MAVVEESYLYARVGVAGGSPALQLRVLSADDAYDANGDLTAGEADWRKVRPATEAYFAAFYAEALTPRATDALARALGVDGRPGDTLAALAGRYLPAFCASPRTAHEAARRIHADPEALPGWGGWGAGTVKLSFGVARRLRLLYAPSIARWLCRVPS